MTHPKSNFIKFEQKYPGIEAKFNENFIAIINKTIEHHLMHNDGTKGRTKKEYLVRLIYAKHIPTFIPEADPNKDKELYEYIGDRVSEEFKAQMSYWKQHQKDFPRVFTKLAIARSKPMEAKFLTFKKSPLEQFTVVETEQVKQPEQKKIQNVSTKIVTMKMDGLKDNFFSVTYCNVDDLDKELLNKHTVQMVELLNNRHREAV